MTTGGPYLKNGGAGGLPGQDGGNAAQTENETPAQGGSSAGTGGAGAVPASASGSSSGLQGGSLTSDPPGQGANGTGIGGDQAGSGGGGGLGGGGGGIETQGTATPGAGGSSYALAGTVAAFTPASGTTPFVSITCAPRVAQCLADRASQRRRRRFRRAGQLASSLAPHQARGSAARAACSLRPPSGRLASHLVPQLCFLLRLSPLPQLRLSPRLRFILRCPPFLPTPSHPRTHCLYGFVHR